VRRLKLADLDLNDEASVQNIIDILRSNYALTYLNLASCNIKLPNLVRISDEFCQCQQLEYLNLGGNRVDAGMSGQAEEQPKVAKSKAKTGKPPGRAELQDLFIENVCGLLEYQHTKLRHLDLSGMSL